MGVCFCKFGATPIRYLCTSYQLFGDRNEGGVYAGGFTEATSGAASGKGGGTGADTGADGAGAGTGRGTVAVGTATATAVVAAAVEVAVAVASTGTDATGAEGTETAGVGSATEEPRQHNRLITEVKAEGPRFFIACSSSEGTTVSTNIFSVASVSPSILASTRAA